MKTKLPLDTAKLMAATLVLDLAPACDRIAVAGSIRRKKADVGDIEVVCISSLVEQPNMFGERCTVETLPARVIATANVLNWKFIKNGPEYKQINLGPCTLDLFITTPEQWGVTFALRTGPAEFSHWLVTHRRYGGGCPSYLSFRDGRVWHGSQALETPEEADVFRILGIPWIEPEQRGDPAHWVY